MRDTLLVVTMIAALGGATCGSRGSSDLPSEDEIEEVLHSALPQDWQIVESRASQAPPGHGPVEATGRLYVLQGPGAVSFLWMDEAGQWHDEPLGRESIDLWVMPGSYAPSARRFFEHHRHVPPKEIYSSKRIRLYASVSHTVVDERRLKDLVSVARSTGWSDIAEKRCSWAGWEEQLADQFRASYG